MDKVELNTAKPTMADIRAQDVRLACIAAAVAGNGNAGHPRSVIERAAAFEAFVLKGAEEVRPGQQSAWRPDP